MWLVIGVVTWRLDTRSRMFGVSAPRKGRAAVVLGVVAAGGPGPLGGDYAQDYRGGGPFSEAETRNIRDLVTKRHVTTLITNHTFTGLVLRPPGLQRLGPPIDEPVYKALGDSMAAANGYKSQLGYQLYDTTGTHRGLDLPRHRRPRVHVRDRPEQLPSAVRRHSRGVPGHGAGDGRGQGRQPRGVLPRAGEHRRHGPAFADLGQGPGGARLRLKKSFKTATSPVENADGDKGAVRLFDDALNTIMDVSEGSTSYAWHINPSTRPIVAKAQGRAPTGGATSPPIVSTGNPPPLPPCPTYFEAGAASCAAGGLEDRVFTVPANSPTVDNGFVNIRLDWTDPNNDYDLEIFKADAGGNAIGDPISSSANSGNKREQTSIGPDPVARQVRRAGDQLRLDRGLRPEHHLRGPRAVHARPQGDLDAHVREPGDRQGRVDPAAVHRSRPAQDGQLRQRLPQGRRGGTLRRHRPRRDEHQPRRGQARTLTQGPAPQAAGRQAQTGTPRRHRPLLRARRRARCASGTRPSASTARSAAGPAGATRARRSSSSPAASGSASSSCAWAPG